MNDKFGSDEETIQFYIRVQSKLFALMTIIINLQIITNFLKYSLKHLIKELMNYFH